MHTAEEGAMRCSTAPHVAFVHPFHTHAPTDLLDLGFRLCAFRAGEKLRAEHLHMDGGATSIVITSNTNALAECVCACDAPVRGCARQGSATHLGGALQRWGSWNRCSFLLASAVPSRHNATWSESAHVHH